MNPIKIELKKIKIEQDADKKNEMLDNENSRDSKGLEEEEERFRSPRLENKPHTQIPNPHTRTPH